MSVIIVVEGATDQPVAEKLALDAGLSIGQTLVMHGKSKIDRDLSKFGQAAKGSPWFVLRDLDRDASCAPAFVDGAKVPRSAWLCFRLAVRAVESWLLADREATARFLAVRPSDVPEAPDEESDPKATIVRLAARSRRASVRKGLVPSSGHIVRVGPEYARAIIELGMEHWDVERACAASPSLRRARTSLRRMATRWHAYVGQRR